MYSESDVEDYDEFASSASNDELSAAELVEKQIAERDARLSADSQAYAWTFDDKDSFLQTNFAHLLSNQQAHRDRWNTSDSPDCYHAVAALLNAAAQGSSAGEQKAIAGATTASTATNGEAVASANTGGYVMSPSDGKPSVASRFLCANFDQCILIPVDKALNRAQLRTALEETVRGMASVGEAGLDVVPGYRHAEPSGWALPISVDPEVLAAVKSRFPGWRSPTPQDVTLFTKPSSGSSNGHAQAQAPGRKSWTRHASQLMRSKERFLACVEAAGGWANVTFVAVDVEAFAITANSIPLPAEYAFVPVHPISSTPAPRTAKGTDNATTKGEDSGAVTTTTTSTAAAAAVAGGASQPKRVKSLHFFSHPGQIPEEEETTILHTCLSTHFIPCYNATFLGHDFRTKVRQLDASLVRNPRVVLINKGSAESPTLMDVQAIRWLYAAALWQQHRFCDVSQLIEGQVDLSQRIPDAEGIRCFDVSVLEDAAAECSTHAREEQNGDASGPAKKASRKKGKATQCCWYHAVVERSEIAVEELHCAMKDAQVLAQRVRSALQKWQPGQTA